MGEWPWFVLPTSYKPRFNIAPSQDVMVVYLERETPAVGEFRWGLVPYWAKDPAIGYKMINAWSEMAADKPAFRGPFRRRRCVVVADGFYEWRREGSRKTPMRIRLPQGSLELWLDPHVQDPIAHSELLKPYPADEMEMFAVNPLVNSPVNDSPACIQRAE